MLSHNNIQKIKKETEEFFKKMEIEVELDFLPQREETLPVNLKTAEPQILIGEGGQTLIEIQRLLKVILKRKIATAGDPFYIDLDINNYKKKKNEYLKELARSTADEVALIKKERALAPMSPYERRIIHLELADRPDITTESIGDEPERKVVIKPYP